MIKIYLHTGSNIGDRKGHLDTVNHHIIDSIGTITRLSNIYQTEAWGLKDQDDFYNQALEVLTALDPLAVLDQIKRIENEMGRVRNKKWDRRIIDVDILFFGNEVFDTERLTVPHPFLHDRNFVLAPLCELIPDFIHPVSGKTIRTLFEESTDTLKAEVLEPDNI